MRAAAVGFVAALCVAAATGRILQDSTLGLSQVQWLWEQPAIYIGSPSIIRAPAGHLVATADRFGSGFTGQPRNVSVYISRDEGLTWTFQAWAISSYWSNLFQLDPTSSDIYLLGTSSDGSAPIKIARSRDGGLTWPPSEGRILFNTTSTYGFATGPTPSLLAHGRVFRAIESSDFGKPWGECFGATLISAPVTADLLDPVSWTMTPPLRFNRSWVPPDFGPMDNPGYLEGNAVLGPDNRVYNLLRFNDRPGNLGNKAILLSLNETTNTLAFERIIDLPGGHTKFVVRHDPQTNMYYTLSNNNTDILFADQRNVLCFCASPDLINWHILDVLLTDDTGFSEIDSVRYTGFHYVDWQFDGESIIYAVRTAYRGAESYHNSNRITFKVLHQFRSLLAVLAGLTSSAGRWDPPFESGKRSFAVVLDNTTSSIDFTLKPLDPAIAFTVNGAPATPSKPISVLLDVGNTTVIIKGSGAGAPVYNITVTQPIPLTPIASVSISGKGYNAVAFHSGATAFSNRQYTWNHVPAALDRAGLSFTQIAGNAPAGSVSIAAKAVTAGHLFAATHSQSISEQLISAGWEPRWDMGFAYTDASDTSMQVYQKTLQVGETAGVPEADFTGCILLYRSS